MWLVGKDMEQIATALEPHRGSLTERCKVKVATQETTVTATDNSNKIEPTITQEEPQCTCCYCAHKTEQNTEDEDDSPAFDQGYWNWWVRRNLNARDRRRHWSQQRKRRR